VLVDEIAAAARQDVGGRSEQLQDIERADDGFLKDVGNGLKDGAGTISGGISDLAELGAKMDVLPHNKALNHLKMGGQALSELGADGLGRKVLGAADFLDRQNDNFVKGVAGGAGGTVEGLAQMIGDPDGTVDGIGAVIQDPGLMLDGYKETLKEQGVSGLLGQTAFDLVGSKGLGAATNRLGEVGRVAEGLDRISNSKIGDLGRGLRSGWDSLDQASGELVDSALASSPRLRKVLGGGHEYRFGERPDLDTAGTDQLLGRPRELAAGKFGHATRWGADQIERWTGHQLLPPQAGGASALTPPNRGPLSNPLNSEWSNQGASAAQALEARQPEELAQRAEQQTSLPQALRSLLECILAGG
jgi:hypothetical protein